MCFVLLNKNRTSWVKACLENFLSLLKHAVLNSALCDGEIPEHQGHPGWNRRRDDMEGEIGYGTLSGGEKFLSHLKHAVLNSALTERQHFG